MAQPKECNIFQNYYPKLCNTLVDIDNLLPYFVQENIIQVDDLEAIKAKTRTTDKVEKLLQFISGPLRAGNVRSFYSLLNIMEEHGIQTTKELATAVKGGFMGVQPNTGELIYV